MATFRMKFVQAYADRHGKMRYYYRRPGFPRVALTGEPGSTAFAKAYEAASGQAPRRIGAERIVQGTFAALIVDYYETEAFTKLGAISRKTRRNVLERFRETFGTMAVRDMTPAKLDEVLEGTTNLKGVRDALRLLFKLAFRRGLIAVSPMDGLRLPKKAKTGFRPWTEADIAALLREVAHRLTRAACAGAPALHRPAPRRRPRHGPPASTGRQACMCVQHKTGAELLIPIHPDLQAELDQIAQGRSSASFRRSTASRSRGWVRSSGLGRRRKGSRMPEGLHGARSTQGGLPAPGRGGMHRTPDHGDQWPPEPRRGFDLREGRRSDSARPRGHGQGRKRNETV
jgi:hypothetical protein